MIIIIHSLKSMLFQGDLEKLRDSDNIFMTVHDVGSSYLSWKRFTNHPDMTEIKAR